MLSDPIVAVATPPGRSALAVVRLSGAGAFAVAARVIQGFRADEPRRATLTTFRAADGTPIDRGLYTVFPAPASYTGEDLVELSCHGGLAVPARLVAALHAAGARPAQRGEFTRRAVLHGKLDLLQAVAVGDLIDATAPAQARAALAQLEGGLSRRLCDLRDRLLELQALLGYAIDFPDEDDGPVPADRIGAALEDAASLVERLLATAPGGERLREGALVVLAGRPNAGKSSLFNALLGTERALVTEVPGTTRDAIEAHTDFLGWPVRLADTAGLRTAEDRVERLGVEVSRRWLAAADLVVLCAEAGRPLAEDEARVATEYPVLVARTKSDLAGAAPGELGVSVISGAGLDRLRRLAGERLYGERLALADLEPGLTRARHAEALARARDALAEAAPHLGPRGEAVLAAHHVRQATLALDELIGTVDVDEVLGRIFSTFCVGK
ncbi:MAG TPA: tRNA uridine-5-carboxymethylaminomethyl(34) synthesis GTPase MnmE [Gemmatimonadales bacterium]|nr:tRNA uridine-5-carboxymethylaminomethyl(34) synthesis GTPase MnmE [Gemmatimonadales bacterium]